MLPLLKPKKYQHLNKISVSKSALIHNYQALKKLHPQAAICPVLKSNAYGHGLKTVGPIFDKFKPKFLIVDSLYEAYELYKLNIKSKILILGFTKPENFKAKKLPFEFVIFDLATAKILNDYQSGCNIHIFVDTGMNREGIQIKNLPEFLTKLKNLKNLNTTGLCSHFADADNHKNNKFNEFQINNFKQALEIMIKNNFNPKWKHISASGGALKNFDKTFNLIRAGVANYGLDPIDKTDSNYQKIKLKPALEFYSTLIQTKKIPKNSLVGYNCTYKTKKSMSIGIIPAGYYDGVDRRLSNKGVIKIRNTFCPIIGRVSMNLTIIDLSKLKNPKLGEKVIIYSANNKDKNSLINAAKTAQTIPYELMTKLAESLKREVIK